MHLHIFTDTFTYIHTYTYSYALTCTQMIGWNGINVYKIIFTYLQTHTNKNVHISIH